MWSWSLTCLTCDYQDITLKVPYLNAGLGSLIAAREHVEGVLHLVRVFIWNDAAQAQGIAEVLVAEDARKEVEGMVTKRRVKHLGTMPLKHGGWRPNSGRKPMPLHQLKTRPRPTKTPRPQQ